MALARGLVVGFTLVQAELGESVAERSKREAEELGGLSANAARSLQRLEDEATLGLADHRVEIATRLGEREERGRRAGGRTGERGREIAEADRRPLAQRCRALERVLQLAHVSGERIREERTERLRREAADLFAVLLREAVDEVLDER